jgi:hypothetical protein
MSPAAAPGAPAALGYPTKPGARDPAPGGMPPTPAAAAAGGCAAAAPLWWRLPAAVCIPAAPPCGTNTPPGTAPAGLPRDPAAAAGRPPAAAAAAAAARLEVAGDRDLLGLRYDELRLLFDAPPDPPLPAAAAAAAAAAVPAPLRPLVVLRGGVAGRPWDAAFAARAAACFSASARRRAQFAWWAASFNGSTVRLQAVQRTHCGTALLLLLQPPPSCCCPLAAATEECGCCCCRCPASSLTAPASCFTAA